MRGLFRLSVRSVEFGGVGKTMHQANEQILVEDLLTLVDVYERILSLYFESEGSVDGRAGNA